MVTLMTLRAAAGSFALMILLGDLHARHPAIPAPGWWALFAAAMVASLAWRAWRRRNGYQGQPTFRAGGPHA